MITYTDIQRFDNMPFEEYLRKSTEIKGFSHSFLKREQGGVAEDLEITDNILLGSLVDSILTEPAKADMKSPLYPAAKAIAYEIKKSFGGYIDKFEKQVSYTAVAEFQGFCMPTTGRLDFLIPKLAVIDLKVTKSKTIPQLIEFMGYRNQLWHYSKMAGVGRAYLLIHSVPLKKTLLHSIDVSSNGNPFWEDKIINFGTYKQTA